MDGGRAVIKIEFTRLKVRNSAKNDENNFCGNDFEFQIGELVNGYCSNTYMIIKDGKMPNRDYGRFCGENDQVLNEVLIT